MDQDLKATPVDRMVCSSCAKEVEVAGRPAFSAVACPHCGTMLSVPVLLGSFLLVERMGSGGMGAVYRGLDTALNRFVAIKVMKAAMGEDAKLVASFIREAQAAAALNHRNIVQIYSCGQEQGQPYIVMELVSGGRMNQLFTREQPMDEVKLLKLSLDVAEGLKAAHEAGLVHGDIKPENVLIDHAGTAKIVDFGLAQFVNAQQNRGEIWGTPYYISPERARGNKADHRSDLYSLGATMFHALTGQPPFDGVTAADVVLARLKHPPPDLKTLRPELADATVALIGRMMAADPALRYPTSASLKSDMTTALEAAKARKSSARTKHKPARSRSSLAIATIAFATLAGIGYWLFSGMDDLGAPPPVAPTRPVKPATPPPQAEKDDLFSLTTFTGPDGVERKAMQVALFAPDEERALAAAFGDLVLGDPMAVHRTLVELTRKLPRQGPRLAWMPLLQAIPLWLADDRTQVEADLKRLSDRFKAAQPDDHPIHMPKVLADYLLGRIDAAAFAARSATWPLWYTDFAAAMDGLRAVGAGDPAAAEQAFGRFLGRIDQGPAWVDALRPAVAHWRDLNRETETANRATGTLIAAGRADAALHHLEATRATLPLLFLVRTDDALRRVQAAQTDLRADRAAIEARTQRITVQADLDAIDRALAGVSPMILRARDYRKAALSLSTLPSDMATREGRAAATWTKNLIDTLDGLKAFIIRSADRQPFTRADGSDLGGDVISATTLGLRVTLDGRAVSTRSWDSLPPASLVRVAEFYAAQTAIPAAERARALAALAAFSLINGATDLAEAQARRAIELDTSQAAQVRRLVPGLIP
ncbi:MAG TPA: protein kinase [Kiritimatiellia bacterium]|nr:protein kinase [Kiritimatiellia bacterium]HMP33281.1 protein kinase [Kiritimatiellia bacterium]